MCTCFTTKALYGEIADCETPVFASLIAIPPGIGYRFSFRKWKSETIPRKPVIKISADRPEKKEENISVADKFPAGTKLSWRIRPLIINMDPAPNY